MSRKKQKRMSSLVNTELKDVKEHPVKHSTNSICFKSHRPRISDFVTSYNCKAVQQKESKKIS